MGFLSTALIGLGLLAQDPPPAPPVTPGTPRVLFLTHSAGFVHPVVKRAERAHLAHAERTLTRAAAPMFAVECTQDCGAITAANLANYAAVVFFTTGELPIAEADRDAFFAWVQGGGAFVGVHSATDTWYQVPAYGELVGGWFDGHPWHQAVRVRVEDRTHPTTFHLGETLDITDEIYQFKAWSRERVHVLLGLTPDLADLSQGKRSDGDYALSWCRDVGEGRMFYTALGHRPEVWNDPRFMTHLLAGLRWTIDRGDRLRRAPEGAVVLDAPGASAQLHHADGAALRWPVEDGAIVVAPGSGSALSMQAYGDGRIHVEFLVPEGDAKEHGNSGVYLQRRYEVQILDSAGQAPTPGICGALYGARAPDFNAALPAGQWQTFDIWFRAPRFADDAKTENARCTVVHNGIVVHHDVELKAQTGTGIAEGPDPQPLLLQDHGSKVRFRNVWVQPLQ